MNSDTKKALYDIYVNHKRGAQRSQNRRIGVIVVVNEDKNGAQRFLRYFTETCKDSKSYIGAVSTIRDPNAILPTLAPQLRRAGPERAFAVLLVYPQGGNANVNNMRRMVVCYSSNAARQLKIDAKDRAQRFVHPLLN